jgi:glycine C-acetyltransferase
MVAVDDSHATGFVGPTGRGTPEESGVMDRVDVITSTFGKALGGASGGFASGRAELVQLLRQRSRPYLFSNSVAPAILGATLKALDLVDSEPERLERLRENTAYFRREMTERGFNVAAGNHPIVPIVLGDETRTIGMARELTSRGLFVVGFTYPVVPLGAARIRVQVSAAHTPEDLETAVNLFEEIGVKVGLLT